MDHECDGFRQRGVGSQRTGVSVGGGAWGSRLIWTGWGLLPLPQGWAPAAALPAPPGPHNAPSPPLWLCS